MSFIENLDGLGGSSRPVNSGVGLLIVMIRSAKSLIAGFLLTLSLAAPSYAKPWRGIVPLRSTRADVGKLLGRSLFEEGTALDYYDVPEGRMNIMYVVQRCQQGLPSGWGNWNVPVDTVVEIDIHLTKPFHFSRLKLPGKRKMKWYTDDTMTTYYRDKKHGVEYSVTSDGMVAAITYGPTANDSHFLCSKRARTIKY